MLIGILREEVDRRGLSRFEVEMLNISEENTYSMLGGGPRWTHKEIAILVKHRFDLDKAAELLDRTRESCRRELYRLGLSRSVTNEKISSELVVVFPQDQIDRRREIWRQGLPRLKELLDKIDKAKKLSPENIKDLAKIVRAMAAFLNALEKWETGEEMLEIWRGGRADSPKPSG